MRDDPEALAADLRLVRLAQTGDPSAVEALGERMRCLARFAARLNERRNRPLSTDQVEDLAQDSAATAVARLEAYSGRMPLEAWLFTICKFTLCNSLRAKLRRHTEDLPHELADDTSDLGTTLERRDEVEERLTRLGGVEALVIRLRCLGELTYQEIGRRLGVPEGTLRSHFLRGMERLRKRNEPPASGQETT